MAVTIDDVKLVYAPPGLTDQQLQSFLETAQMVVSEQLMGCGMSVERLDKITVYLTLHFAETSATAADGLPGTLRRSKLGEADESYAVPTGSDIQSAYRGSRWGQLAIALDLCNKLIETGELKAQFRVV